MVRLEEALKRLMDVTAPLACQPTPVADCLGLVAAKRVTAPAAVPAFRRAAMDGFAVSAAAVALAAPQNPVVLPVTGELLAGPAQGNPAFARGAVRIATGAPVPDWADAVVQVEWTRPAQEGGVAIHRAVASGQNIALPGEDVLSGTVLARPGQRLGPMQVGLLAAVGVDRVVVHRRVRVLLCSTGDELALPGTTLRHGQVYDSNRVTLAALLQAEGVSVDSEGPLPDHPEVLRERLARAEEESYDLVLTTGGVSIGPRDLMRGVWGELRAQELFWRVAMKPGKPVYAGRRLQGGLAIALPGTPGACLTAYFLLVRPVLRRLQGHRALYPAWRMATLAQGFARSVEVDRFLPGRWEDGMVQLLGHDRTGSLAQWLEANCLVAMPQGGAPVPPGSRVGLLPLWEEPKEEHWAWPRL